MATGILALQGAFAEHAAMLDRLGEPHFEIRQARDLEKPLDRLIIPGGESTVMRRLLHDLALYDTLRELILEGMPVFGTCAGLILLAKQVDGGVPCFATMDIAVKRNAYGRQLGSFFTNDSFEGLGTLPMTFIRAPYIESVSAARSRSPLSAARSLRRGRIISSSPRSTPNSTKTRQSMSIFSKCETEGRSKKRASFSFPFRIILLFVLFRKILFRARTGVLLLYPCIILLPVYRICQFLLAGVEAYLMQALHGVLTTAQPVHPSAVIGDIEFRRIVIKIERLAVIIRLKPVGQLSLRVSAQNFGNTVHFDLRQQLPAPRPCRASA